MSSKQEDTSPRERQKGELVDELAREVREQWVPPPSKDDQAAKLFARIDAYERVKTVAPVEGTRFWGPALFITAVAAGVVFFAHPRGDGSAEVEHSRVPTAVATHGTNTQADEEAPRPTAPAELTTLTHGGDLQVDGVQRMVRELSLRDGQRLEAHGGEAVFAAPGRVDWLLEGGTDLSMVRAGTHGGAIVLALRTGAVEAQVVPVPAGEAFAVDVEGVRVAVHGTHLRVARDGAHVVVDLSEGVISVGAPRKAGSTVGRLVTAPAHVEFSVDDVEGTLREDREAAHVRPPVDPASLAESGGSEAREVRPTTTVSPVALAAPPPMIAMTAPRNPSPSPPKPVNPTEIVVAAAVACADKTLPKNGAIISSMLTVDVNADGTARLAVFNPPTGSEPFQSCVASTVYATPWGEPGSRQIPIELHR